MEDTDPALIPHDKDIGVRSTFRSFFNDLRRIKYFGRPVLAATDANLNVLKYLFYEINLDQRLFVIPPNAFFLSTTDQVSTRIVKRWSRLPLNIAALKRGKGLPIDASIMRFSKKKHTMGIPLATISVGSLSSWAGSWLKITIAS